MTVIRVTLNDGTIFYIRMASPPMDRATVAIIQAAFLRPVFTAIQKMMELVLYDVVQATVMEMPEHEYFALPLMPEELSNRGLVSRWEVRVSDG